MCGICGVVQISGEPRPVIPSRVLLHMTDTMTHRGTDDRGIYEAPGVSLGMRRLSIVDVAGGHQPVANEKGDVVAIQNGELYNHELVRRNLDASGHRFHTRCDTEVIPHLYEERGPHFAEELRGMFGIAVWDETRRRAVLARDRLGIKPLYWALSDDLLVFASELKSLLASGLVVAELDYDAIDAYLTLGFFPAPGTPLARVSKLLPGHILVVEDGAFRTEQYWRYPEPVPDAPRLRVEEYQEGLLAALEESVRIRLMSDVPLGVMLSGGLDSSLIAALMARNMSEPVKTFSVGFSDERKGNELADARYVSKVLGTEHHELELSFLDDSVDLAELVWQLDEPMADMSALGFEALSGLASKHVTVALSGQGADELLGGYTKHRAASLVGASMRLPASARHAAAAVAARGPARVRRAARTLDAQDPATRLIEMSGRLGGGLRESLYRGPLAGKTGAAALDAVRRRQPQMRADPLASTLTIDTQLALADDMLHYFDRTSMAHSLEVRVPFLDHHVVEYCAHIPSDLKVHLLQTKWLLKRAARGLVPLRIIYKRKLGFLRDSTSPWLRAQLRDAYPDLLFGPESQCAAFLDRGFLEQLAVAHRDGSDSSNDHLLVALLMLELWLRSYLPRALARPAEPHDPAAVAAT
ncbi:MAG TPA: asparagine synthase (glutamine-hydrolyzing) [Solirubrobacteraceae bacterium]